MALEPDTEEFDWKDRVVRSFTQAVGGISRGKDREGQGRIPVEVKER